MRYLSLLFVMLLVSACEQSVSKKKPAEEAIDKAIATMGGEIIDNAKISFQFRDKFYTAYREQGAFELKRCSDRSCKDTVDVIDNAAFSRSIGGKKIDLDDKTAENLKNSVNSVHYFSVLPYGLNAAAVQKSIMDTVLINGQNYYEIKVSFQEDGGGKDYEDQYMYWVNTEKFTVDYLAYNYQVNEGGTRFRVAYNPRTINGVRIVDYKNYKPREQYPPLQALDSLYLDGKLDLLSKIDLENVSVKNCPNC